MMNQKSGIPPNTAGTTENIYSRYYRINDFEYPKGVRLAVNFTVDYDTQLNRKLKNGLEF